MAQADNSQGLTVKLRNYEFLPPGFLLICDKLWCPFRQHEHQAQNVLGDRYGLNAADVGDCCAAAEYIIAVQEVYTCAYKLDPP